LQYQEHLALVQREVNTIREEAFQWKSEAEDSELLGELGLSLSDKKVIAMEIYTAKGKVD